VTGNRLSHTLAGLNEREVFMKTLLLSGIIIIVSFAAGSVLAEQAEEVTLSGEMMCAKCTLKVEGATKCQDVLVTKGEDGKKTHYYVVKNEVAEKAGHTCTSKRPATATGTIAEQDGMIWLTASSLEYTE
jgi:hypothetical protein